jgi:uncharacterized protein (TIGR00730 family)
MGKSYGNFITMEQLFNGEHPKLEQAYSPMTIRFFILQAHYRSTLDFSNAALQAGGTVTGVIPHFMVEQGWHHTGLTRLVKTETMHERKQRMAEMSDGVIALPGGCGTLEELLEIITWKQLGLYLKPIVILNINGYFDPLIEMLHRAIDESFMRCEHADIWRVATSAHEAVELLYTTPPWNKNVRKLAAI